MAVMARRDLVKEAIAKGIQDMLVNGISLPPNPEPLTNKYGWEVELIEAISYDWLNTRVRVTFQGGGDRSEPQIFNVRVSEQY
jgi:hypothetical protein